MTLGRGKWTNASVLTLESANDPVAEITRRAQGLVSQALDAGWGGPPFDPLTLAELLGIEVVPTAGVQDARTTAVGESRRFRIEFNPNRPAARVRFSLAHEIAHTLFPDCAHHVRNRAAYHELTADGWQLEALCNIAAAEFLMPAGSLPAVNLDEINPETMVTWQRRYEVSMEALLLRLTRLSAEPCAMFCASVPTTQLTNTSDAYHVDYAIGSASWGAGSLRGAAVPPTSVVTHCAGVGFTAYGDESWPNAGGVHVQCVAVPPYPGSIRPRVVGILRPKASQRSSQAERGSLRIVRGDATRPRGDGLKIIAHVVNDATPNWGGGGFASALRRRFDDAQMMFRDWAHGDRAHLRLGNVHFAEVSPSTRIATVVAQHGYGPSVNPRLRYSALRSGLAVVGLHAAKLKASVHVPRIGAGQAGGSWSVIEGLIRELICVRGVAVTVYDFPNSPVPQVPAQQLLDI